MKPIAILFALPALAALIAFAPAVFAADEEPTTAEVVANIQRAYEKTRTLTAGFEQTLTNAASNESKTRQGHMAYMRPQHIRWTWEEPESEVLLVTPDSVWNYFPEEYLAYRYPVEQVLDSRNMLRFISGEVRLDEDFYVENLGLAEGDIMLELIPKEPEVSLVSALARVNPETWLLRGIAVRDFYNNENRVLLRDPVVNPELDADLFTFDPPEDVEVLDNRPATVEERDLSE